MRFLPQLSAEGDTVRAGQAEIKEDAVELLCNREMKAGYAISRSVDAVTASFKKIVEIAGYRPVIFDYEYTHDQSPVQIDHPSLARADMINSSGLLFQLLQSLSGA